MTGYSQGELFKSDELSRLKTELNKTKLSTKIGAFKDERALLEDEALTHQNYDNITAMMGQESFRNKKQNRKLRKEYANRAYDIACGCIAFWMVIVLLSAILQFTTGKVFLSDTALGIVTTAVTINVFGAFMVVMKGLFAKIE